MSTGAAAVVVQGRARGREPQGPPHSRGIRAGPGLPARACPPAPARERGGLGGTSLRPDWDVGLWADWAQLSRAHGRAGLWHGKAVAQAEPKHRTLSQKQLPQAGVGCGCRLLVTQHCQGACPHGFGGVGLPWAVVALSRLWASMGKCTVRWDTHLRPLYLGRKCWRWFNWMAESEHFHKCSFCDFTPCHTVAWCYAALLSWDLSELLELVLKICEMTV